MKQNEIRNSVPQIPAHFVRRMDETLERIENMNHTQRKSRHTARTLLIAAMITILLAGTAFAVGRVFGIFELMSLKPREGAENIIQTHLGQTQSEYGTVAVEEAAYSGRGLSVLIRTQPKEGYDYSWPEFSLRNAEYLDWSYHWKVGDQETLYLQSAMLTGDEPEVLEGKVEVLVSNHGEVVDTLRVPFRVQRTEANSAQLVPLNESEQWQLVSANLSFGEIFATFEVRYICDAETEDDMGVDILLFDAGGNQLKLNRGNQFGEEGEDGTIIYGWRTQYQSFETIPEKLIIKPYLIGEGAWLDPIECAVMLK